MADYRRFIILCPPRSGSNMLVSALNWSPEIVCFRELFNFAADYVDFNVEGYDRASAEDRALRDSDFRAFIEQRVFCAHNEGVRAVGFKAMYNQLPFFPGLSKYLAGLPDIFVIRLQRRNLLRTFVSLRIAETTDEWVWEGRPPLTRRLAVFQPIRQVTRSIKRLLRPDRGAAPRAVRLTPEECRFYFAWAERSTKEYADQFAGHPLHLLCYEDLVSRARPELERVQQFLGLVPKDLPIGTLQQNPEPLRALIVNYDELFETFRGTEFGTFFDE
jgi:hypothetical protein